MGIINHNAVIATTWNNKQFLFVKKWIKNIQDKNIQQLFLISNKPQVNGEKTICMIPDGSKEGWETSNVANDWRELFIRQIEESGRKEGYCAWRWVEVGFGEYGQKVLRGNNQNCYSDAEYAGA